MERDTGPSRLEIVASYFHAGIRDITRLARKYPRASFMLSFGGPTPDLATTHLGLVLTRRERGGLVARIFDPEHGEHCVAAGSLGAWLGAHLRSHYRLGTRPRLVVDRYRLAD